MSGAHSVISRHYINDFDVPRISAPRPLSSVKRKTVIFTTIASNVDRFKR